ncbi:hypothetical protein HMPREF0972_01379 [Actinomyces sp. oral taxon 848 str. F0332]|nr:hypothetical protein HMPREF0972_01379 [Actinomyces sp. oral taxon 848 str. F0332]
MYEADRRLSAAILDALQESELLHFRPPAAVASDLHCRKPHGLDFGLR